jgi:hypothetical protein
MDAYDLVVASLEAFDAGPVLEPADAAVAGEFLP